MYAQLHTSSLQTNPTWSKDPGRKRLCNWQRLVKGSKTNFISRLIILYGYHPSFLGLAGGLERLVRLEVWEPESVRTIPFFEGVSIF